MELPAGSGPSHGCSVAASVDPIHVPDSRKISTARQSDILLVEGVGGPRSPLSADGDTVNLARLSAPTMSSWFPMRHSGLSAAPS